MITLLRVGHRIRLTSMHDAYDPIRVGPIGKVIGIPRHGAGKDV